MIYQTVVPNLPRVLVQFSYDGEDILTHTTVSGTITATNNSTNNANTNNDRVNDTNSNLY